MTPESSFAEKKVVLVGNPNVGKSVIFRLLTGSYVLVSNFPGTTVEKAGCNRPGRRCKKPEAHPSHHLPAGRVRDSVGSGTQHDGRG